MARFVQMAPFSGFLTKTRAYWLCQLVGWLGFWLTQFYSFKALGFYSPTVPGLLTVTAVIGVGLTHLYRTVVVRAGWLAGTWRQQLAVAGSGLVVLSTVLHLTGSGWAALESGDWMLGDPNRIWLGISNWGRYLSVWLLAYHFFAAGERLTQVQVGQLRTEAALRQAELDTLRAQVNPHFLFNALNSIRALTLTDPHAARTAVTQLSDLLRYSLRYGQQPVIALREELAAVHDYLALEQTRFGARLLTRIDVPPTVLGWLVPPAVVLTLVENAVKHGISASSAGGELCLSAESLSPVSLLIEVRQPGSLRLSDGPSVALAPRPDGSGLGLHNTRQRLAALYGSTASCSLTESPSGTVVAALRLPAAPTLI
jgi:two-component system, LytTR family, sensor kinase